MKKMFLTLALVLVGSFTFASNEVVNDSDLNLDEFKKMPYIISTTCGATVQGEGDFTTEEFFDLMDQMEELLCP